MFVLEVVRVPDDNVDIIWGYQTKLFPVIIWVIWYTKNYQISQIVSFQL